MINSFFITNFPLENIFVVNFFLCLLFTSFLGELLKLSVPMDAAGIKRYKTFKMQYVKKSFC